MAQFSYKVEDLAPRLTMAIWKITLNCNFRCKHCGFSAGNCLIDELSTDEALNLCDQLGEANCEEVVLTGGEPLTRKDWSKIARKLASLGIKVSLVSNGYLLSEKNLLRAIDSGVSGITISIDGIKNDHDNIRQDGSYEKAIHAIEMCKNHGVSVGVITTVNKINFDNLPGVYESVVNAGTDRWQVQLSDGIGYMDDNRSEMLTPSELIDVERVLITLYEKNERNGTPVQLSIGDNLGYFSDVDKFYRKDFIGGCYTGCFAGIYVIGIESNGDIKGCPTLSEDYVEGNIRNQSVSKIFFSSNNFQYNRTFDDNSLTGYCAKCDRRQLCRGGCLASRLGSKNAVTENKYCLKRVKAVF